MISNTFALKNLKATAKDVINMNDNVNELIRTIEFDKKYLWKVRFLPKGDSVLSAAASALNIPPQFFSFFPVADVDIDYAALTLNRQETLITDFAYPQRTRSRSIKLTFYDDVNKTLLNWFSDWINVDILNCGRYISCLDDNHPRVKGFGNVQPVRKIMVEHQNANGNLLYAGIYDVIPEGEIVFNGAYTSDIQMYTLNFAIVKDFSTRPSTGFAFADAGITDITSAVSNKIFGK